MIMAHEAMPRWAMDPFITPWDGPRNLTLSNISPAPVKRGPLRRGGRLLLAGADSFRVHLCPVRCASSRGSHTVTATTSWHGVRGVLSIGDVTLSPQADESQEAAAVHCTLRAVSRGSHLTSDSSMAASL
jgi:hypothetical protein